jgi:hypothetical protein
LFGSVRKVDKKKRPPQQFSNVYILHTTLRVITDWAIGRMEGAVNFKKRAPKGGSVARRKADPDSGDDEDEVCKTALSDVKLQQSVRQRKHGATVDALGKPTTTGSSSSSDGMGTKTIESVMGTQYTSQIDYGVQASVPHKKLMDQYIEEKLGAARSSM